MLDVENKRMAENLATKVTRLKSVGSPLKSVSFSLLANYNDEFPMPDYFFYIANVEMKIVILSKISIITKYVKNDNVGNNNFFFF